MTDVGSRLGIAPTCAALGLPRATYYRRRRPQSVLPRRWVSPRALSDTEGATVLALLHEPRFVDLSPAEVYATLLDEGRYLCSERTMYRILAAHQEVHGFPERFGAIQGAPAHCHVFFTWYNTEHHHAGLGLLTPFDVHQGRAEQRVAARAAVLAAAHGAHPERFPAGFPHPRRHPAEVWINPPKV